MDFDYTDEFFALYLALYTGQMKRGGIEYKQTFVFLDSKTLAKLSASRPNFITLFIQFKIPHNIIKVSHK